MAIDDLAVLPEHPFDFLMAFSSGEPTGGGFSSREFDQLATMGIAESTWEKAKATLRQAETMLLQEATVLPLLHGTLPILIKQKVQGYTPNLFDLHPWEEISLQ